MNTDNSGITIKWKLEDVTSNSIVWSSGSQVNIVRTDNVSAKDVYIPIEDKSVTSYVDKDLTTCREYTYSVMVRPGSNKYTDTKKIQAVTNGKLIPSVLAKIKSVTASKGYFSEYTRVTCMATSSSVREAEQHPALTKANELQNTTTKVPNWTKPLSKSRSRF